MQEPDDDVELEMLDTEFGDDITVAYALDEHGGHTGGGGCLVSVIGAIVLLAILLLMLAAA